MVTGEFEHEAAGGRLTVDLIALTANYRALADRVAPATAAAVVKADAYGLGAERVAPALEQAGCRHFFVALFSEAVSLKPSLAAGSKLYVLNGLMPGAEPMCAALGVIPVLNSLEQARRWRAEARKRRQPLPAVVQVDSGMARLGLTEAEVEVLAIEPGFFDDVPLVLVMSHLACADEADSAANPDQLRRFNALADLLPAAPRSLSNSGGSQLDAAFHGGLVRLGVGLYGVTPQAGGQVMRPVVRLTARVVQLRDVAAGAGVGYGLTYARTSPGRIATVAVGYADGWPRHLSNVGAAWFAGVRLPIAGRVSMDSMSLDVTALADHGLSLSLGDEVELIGPHQTLDEVAEAAGTIPYEILTGLGRRYHRTYVEEPIMQQTHAAPRLAGAAR